MPALDSTESTNILAAQLKATTYPAVTTVYVALGTSQPAATTMTTEVSGGSYARQVVTFGTVSAQAVPSNSAATFTNMPAATVTACELHGTLSGTTRRLYWQGASQSFTSKTTAAGDTLTFASGAITATVT